MKQPAAAAGLRALPGLRVLVMPIAWRVVAAVAVFSAILYTVLVWRPELLDPPPGASDAWNYLAAAERLRAGHSLTSIGPGDRPVVGFPSMFPLPLVAPPTMAVLSMPMLLFSPDVATMLWTIGGFIVTIATVAWLIARGGIRVQILVIALAFPTAVAAFSGNVNTYLLPVLMASWLGIGGSNRGGLVGGAATGLATAVRVGPALIGLLYVVRRRWVAAVTAASVLGVVGLLSLLVAGPDTWATYLRVSLGGSLLPTALSVPGMLTSMGVGPAFARLGVAAVWVIAGVAIVLLRDRPRLAFVVAIVAAVYATPVVRMESWVLLLAIAAPWVLGDATEAARHAPTAADFIPTTAPAGSPGSP